MSDNFKRIMQRVEWIKKQLRSGRHWNISTLADEFSIHPKTAQRIFSEFRRAYPDWRIRFDKTEKTYYLDAIQPIAKPSARPGRMYMSAAEFAAIRERLLLTQGQLADCIGKAQSVVSGWEKGKSIIPADVVMLMRAWDRARLFGIWRGRLKRIHHKE